MNNWVLGTDTSHWDGAINFDIMYKAGAKFWITKATDANRTTGRQFEDSRFQEYCEAATKTPLLMGCYHWLQASVDPIEAAKFYLERYNRFDFDFPPIMDFEESSVRDTKLFSDYAWRAQEWVRYCEDKTGRKPIIYTARWFTSYFKTSYLSWMGDYPLWVADYSWWANNVTKAPYYFPSNIWDDWHIWQYSDKGDGATYGAQSASVDLNWYQGSYADLMEWLGTEQPEQPLTFEEKVDILWDAHQELHP